MTKLDLEKVNEAISDRSNVFYWQTDRNIKQSDVAEIWSDRHSKFSDLELIQKVNNSLVDDELIEIEPFNPDAPLSLGNINSVRIGKLNNAGEVVIRCHPKGVVNGYFYAETLASNELINHNLPGYKTFTIHDFESDVDFAFQVIQKLPGVPVQTWLQNNPGDEKKIMHEVGKTMALMNEIEVEGFGPFNNQLASKGLLFGMHTSFVDSLRASLDSNLEVLVNKEILNMNQSRAIDSLFSEENILLGISKSVLVHNDFADWNQMTDGETITGIIDLDEVIGGHPISDIACWSTFFDPDRLELLLEGYFSVSPRPDNFDELFELLRLRYVVSKMTLRLRKSSWDDSQFLKDRINSGSKHLMESLRYFGI